MNLLNFTIASVVDATTGSHLAQTTHSAHRHNNNGAPLTHKHSSKTSILQRSFKALSSFAHERVAAYKAGAQRRKDTAQILQFSAHDLRDIGLSNNDLLDLKAGQISLEALNARRFESQGNTNLRLKKPNISRVRTHNLTAANQDSCALASCG